MGVAAESMFFAGLILLIPHRIGMSRVNYVIKRYNLPISRAGLLLYKYHNNIELSLLCGTLPGNIIVWCVGMLLSGDNQQKNNCIKYCNIAFLILMLISSIIMFIIYISGGDFGHLNAFYFSLIFLTLFDGFTNAFAFAINGKNSSLLAAGIPISGFLVTVLHYIYKFISDSYHLDDFDYYVLLIQLLINIITIFIARILWSLFTVSNKFAPSLNLSPLFKPTADKESHLYDWSPIFMLAISLGTVYAFYPSIAPYSIIDFQYASIIELWILIISALLPFIFAILDLWDLGPSGKVEEIILIEGDKIEVHGTNNKVKFTEQSISLTNVQVKHSNRDHYHPRGSECPQKAISGDPQDWHDYTASASVPYTTSTKDKYWDPTAGGKGQEAALPDDTTLTTKMPKSISYKVHLNWFFNNTYYSTIKNSAGSNDNLIMVTGGNPTQAVVPSSNIFSRHQDAATQANISWTKETPRRWCFSLVWISAIFYILCIQIFMSMLHYPHCLLSCICDNNPYIIVFISILFNTLRELMQACAFSGAGKQCMNNHVTSNSFLGITLTGSTPSHKAHNFLTDNAFKSLLTDIIYKEYTLSGTDAVTSEALNSSGKLKIPTNKEEQTHITLSSDPGGNTKEQFTEIKATSSTQIKIPNLIYSNKNYFLDQSNVTDFITNGSIAATNKLITLFVMMFCVFTGDGYLQHYRRCCRDCWPTTGYTKYQSFFYWLHFGFKGGIKSITFPFNILLLFIHLYIIYIPQLFNH